MLQLFIFTVELMWSFNSFPHINAFWWSCLCSRRLFKSLWQKEKSLIMSSFSNLTQWFQLYSIIIQSLIEILLYFGIYNIKVVCCRHIVRQKRVYPYPHIDAFWKHSDKRRNCSKQAISPFSTMFTTFSHRLYISIQL